MFGDWRTRQAVDAPGDALQLAGVMELDQHLRGCADFARIRASEKSAMSCEIQESVRCGDGHVFVQICITYKQV